MAPLVIPIFISHQGCPQRCIFCDQDTITGHTGLHNEPVTTGKVKEIIEQWLRRPRKEDKNCVQVAFYGGSFTGLLSNDEITAPLPDPAARPAAGAPAPSETAA